MKIIFLLLTLLFSASVLADCCNFEFESTFDHGQVIEENGNHCEDSSDQPSQPEHCHCTPLNHVRIISTDKLVLVPPPSFPVGPIASQDSLFDSIYGPSIFHPPIA